MKNLILSIIIVAFISCLAGCGAGDRIMNGKTKLNDKGEVVGGDDFYVDEWYRFRVTKATVNSFENKNNQNQSLNNTSTIDDKSTPFQDSRGWLLGYVVNKTNWGQSVNIWNDEECVASFYLQSKDIVPAYLMPTLEDEFYFAYWNGKSPLKGDKPDWTFQVNPWKEVNMNVKTNNGTEQKKCAWFLY